MLVMGLVLGPSLMIVSTTGILLYAKVYPLYKVLWECIVVVYNIFVRSLHIGSLGHWTLLVYIISDLYLLPSHFNVL